MWFLVVGIFVCVASLNDAQYLLGLAEGEVCSDRSEGQWICAAQKQCTHVDLKIMRPTICSFRGKLPIICCPPKKKMSKAETSCLKHTELCNGASMYRAASGRSLSGKPLEWTSDDDNDAEVLEVPSESQTTTNDSEATPSSTTSQSDDQTGVETTSPMTTETNHSASNSSNIPKLRQFVVGGHLSLPRTQRHMVFSSNSPQAATEGCLRYIAEIPCPVKTSKPGQVHTAVVGGKKSESKTQRHMRKTEQNDTEEIPVFGIAGGQPAPSKKHREMALIGYGPKNNIDWRCGGSLVSDLWVLSAAHCTNTADSGPAAWARLGELDHSTNTDDARPQDQRIVQRINHPQYKEPLKYHDIALYKLESRVLFDQYVAPICLHTAFDIDEPKATVVGWGRTDFADDVSSRLMEVDITLIDNPECRRLYGSNDPTAPRGIERLTMLCAGEKDGGKDACTGDSGGPMVINQAGSCLKKQVGITSFGRDCGLPNSPGIYTRVSSYVGWIESIVWP